MSSLETSLCFKYVSGNSGNVLATSPIVSVSLSRNQSQVILKVNHEQDSLDRKYDENIITFSIVLEFVYSYQTIQALEVRAPIIVIAVFQNTSGNPDCMIMPKI